jgi:hypothetical protein
VAQPIEEAELKRREYELKRHDFLSRVFDTHYAIAMRLTALALAGNLGAIIVIWTALKDTRPPAVLVHAKWAIGMFSMGLFMALLALSSYFIATGAIKTMWQTAAGRHFDPPVEYPTADEASNRAAHNVTNRAADSLLIWSSVAFTIGAVYSMWALSTLLKS